MKTAIDKETCIGCGLCVQIAPGVYEMRGDKAVVLLDEVPEDRIEEVKSAVEQCPVNSISAS